MIYVVLGMMGSGKTTWCLNNMQSQDILIDFDALKQALNTEGHNIQLAMLSILKTWTGNDVAGDIYFTMPRFIGVERELISEYKYELIWINQSVQECTRRIINRNRGDEAKNVNKMESINEEIYSWYLSSGLRFRIINDQEEWW